MIAALLGSSKPSSGTCKVAVRRSKAAHVSGMGKGDIVQINFSGKTLDWTITLHVEENIVLEIPEGSEWAEVRHVFASGSCVFVDLR